jgi:hypothetical protein
MEEAVIESAATELGPEDAVLVRALEAALTGDLTAIKRAIEEDGVDVDLPDDDGVCNFQVGQRNSLTNFAHVSCHPPWPWSCEM